MIVEAADQANAALDHAARVAARPTFDRLLLDFAQALSQRSTCRRLQVGCVIASADHRRVYAIGYNGSAAGGPNDCDSAEPGKCGCVHAEANACIKCDVAGELPKVVYVTDLPCVMCAKFLINMGGVQRVLYGRDYRIRDGLEWLRRAGIEAAQL